MGSKSNYLENKVINLLFGGTAYSVPATYYVGLWCSADGELDDTSTGASAGEISGNGYERVEVSNDTSSWGADTTTGIKSNAIDITFPVASGAWGSAAVDQIAVLDASSGGNIIVWGDLAIPKLITSGDTVRLNAGDLVITEQ